MKKIIIIMILFLTIGSNVFSQKSLFWRNTKELSSVSINGGTSFIVFEGFERTFRSQEEAVTTFSPSFGLTYGLMINNSWEIYIGENGYFLIPIHNEEKKIMNKASLGITLDWSNVWSRYVPARTKSTLGLSYLHVFKSPDPQDGLRGNALGIFSIMEWGFAQGQFFAGMNSHGNMVFEIGISAKLYLYNPVNK